MVLLSYYSYLIISGSRRFLDCDSEGTPYNSLYHQRRRFLWQSGHMANSMIEQSGDVYTPGDTMPYITNGRMTKGNNWNHTQNHQTR